MTNKDAVLEAMERRAERRQARRDFLCQGGALAVTVAGASLLSGCDDDNNNNDGDSGGVIVTPTPTPPPPPTGLTDADILNFALNLEYLEAQFYSYAATGQGLPEALLGGTGLRGQARPGRQVAFQDQAVARYAREIAADERAHVTFLRSQLGAAAIAQPEVDVSFGPTSAFSSAARAAGLVGAGQAFDPYASDDNFLLGAFIFEDVGVTAYKGASPLLTSKVFLEAAAGILAIEAYHAGLIRTTLYARGVQTPQLRASTEAISNARDSLDGPTDLDQGVAPIGDMSNIAPSDPNGIAFSRTPGQVLNIAFLNRMAVTQGGFFPQGVNGLLVGSAPNG